MYRGISGISFALAVGVGAMFANAGAFGATTDSLLHPGTNQISDDTGEVFVNQVGVDTTVDVGDVFLAVIGINTVNGTVVGGATPNNELTGVFAVQVASVSPATPASCGGLSSCSSFTFAPVADIAAAFTAAGFTGVPTGSPANTLALLFEDPANNYKIASGDFQTLINEVVGGTQRMVLTISPGQLGATAPADLTQLGPLDQGAGIGSIIGSATIVSETFALDFLPKVQVIGNVSTPNENEQFSIRDDITFTLVAVPEPKTASLLGSGLLILGLFALRRRKSERAV